jgi:tRNA-binding EMAP/Myf-like protein
LDREQVEETQPEISKDDFEKVDMRVAEVLSAKATEGLRAPSRVFELDLGPLGPRQSVGQYALVREEDLVGKKVIVCINLGTVRFGRNYKSEVLVMGAPHPNSPSDQRQALPLTVDPVCHNGAKVF